MTGMVLTHYAMLACGKGWKQRDSSAFLLRQGMADLGDGSLEVQPWFRGRSSNADW